MKPECDTRQRLLETAMDLIWEQSYGAVSVDVICERAGAKKEVSTISFLQVGFGRGGD